MTQLLKLSALVFFTSVTGLVHADVNQHNLRLDTPTASADANTSQTAGLYGVHRGYRPSRVYSAPRPVGYRSSGYGFGSHYGAPVGYGHYAPSPGRWRTRSYAPAYRGGYVGTEYRTRYDYGYGTGCGYSGYGGGRGYFGY